MNHGQAAVRIEHICFGMAAPIAFVTFVRPMESCKKDLLAGGGRSEISGVTA